MNFIIDGGNVLSGEIDVPGAKNAFFPIAAACFLTENDIILDNIPLIGDALEKLDLMEYINTTIKYLDARKICINTKDIRPIVNNFDSRIRTTILFSGVFLGRFGHFQIPYPKGDKIGARNINFFIESLSQMGATFTFYDNYFEGKADKLIGIEYTMPFASNGATHNMIIAASLAHGTTIINNASIEPETISLCYFLYHLGVKIEGIGRSRIVIEGSCGKLYNKNLINEFKIISDRIQAGTYLIAGAMTNGDVTIKGEEFILTLGSFLNGLTRAGCELICNKDSVRCISKNKFTLEEYEILINTHPGFHTDLLPLFVPLLCCRSKSAIVKESIHDNRFQYMRELQKMGANIEFINNETVKILHIDHFERNMHLIAHDIRGGGSVLLAALNASGKSRIYNSYQIYRGYDNLIYNLCSLGANIDLENNEIYEKSSELRLF